jgi:hypothetical protein
MKSEENIYSTNESINYLINKANEDSEFKNKLINNPLKTIREIDSTFSIKEGKIIKIEDQTDKNLIFLNIPRMPNTDEVELSEEELEQVSGGTLTLYLIYKLATHDGDININIQIGNNNYNNQG